MNEFTHLFADRDEPPQLFLCHSSDDKRFVSTLARDLRSLQIRVWYDKWSLQVGDSLHEAIGAALEKSAFVAVILSPSSVSSAWCQSELDQALTREKREARKIVLPLLHRRVQPPAFLEGRLYLKFSRSYLQAVARLAGFMRGYKVEQIDAYLKSHKPQSVGDIAVILDKCSPQSRINVLPAEKYMALRLLLEETGVDVGSQMFSVADRGDSNNLVIQVDEFWVSGHRSISAREDLDAERSK